ncbi:MAG: phospho-N-acetylmuramoyl-pentapeptide-transferase [Bacteroidales bacterium]|nr:phospho-N-acetylmuramoyl-pentapeptide-transferase [Bacteroidales bacterium]
MLYYLFDWLDKALDIPGAGVFQYISFRAAASAVTSLIIMLVFGKPFIKWIGNRLGMHDTVRTELGLEGATRKSKTPTMGGLLILAAIIIPTLLFAKLDNIYIQIMLGTTVWLGLVGFLDDYLKKTRGKAGLPGIYKVIGQVTLGLVVGLLILYHPDIAGSGASRTTTTIPFVKNNELDYAKLITWIGPWAENLVWLLYVVIVILVVTAVSNASNLTDGIDGIATGVAAVNGGALAILAWLSGNIIFSNYLNIMYLPNIGELTIFSTAFVGATLGFFWFNSHPAEIFMGDTGSLAIGGIIAVFAILIRKELLLPLLCGIYVVENLSVIIQTMGCKIYRRRHHLPQGTPVPIDKRPFLMTPIHHHYQKKGIPEQKVVQRFIIVAILLAILSIVTLKLR